MGGPGSGLWYRWDSKTKVEDCRVLVNNCGSKEGLEGEFIRVACRTEEDNGRLVDAFMRVAKYTESGRLDTVPAR